MQSPPAFLTELIFIRLYIDSPPPNHLKKIESEYGIIDNDRNAERKGLNRSQKFFDKRVRKSITAIDTLDKTVRDFNFRIFVFQTEVTSGLMIIKRKLEK